MCLDLPRFFHFSLVEDDGPHVYYWTTALNEDPDYIRFSSYWHDLVATGALPFAVLVFFNAKIYMKVGGK